MQELTSSRGLDAIGRVWDLRSGNSIFLLRGHLRGITGADFSPNGYQVATCSDDDTFRIWDLRYQKCEVQGAHTHLVSHIRYAHGGDGKYLVTGSYDGTAKIWGADELRPLAVLAGHEDKVMCVDVSLGKQTPLSRHLHRTSHISDNKYILTSSYDHTFKLWMDMP